MVHYMRMTVCQHSHTEAKDQQISTAAERNDRRQGWLDTTINHVLYEPLVT